MNENEFCILLVEDDLDLLAASQAILEMEGHAVLTATNGREALQVLERVRPDLIAADIMMPEMDGYAFYEAVRKREEWTAIPFIFLTAKATKDDVLKGKALGAEDYITKPFNAQELIVAVRSRLERAQAIQAASEVEFEQLKQQIAEVVGHELRTPLTFVRSYTDLALESISFLEREELERFLAGIKLGADRLTRLAEDFQILIRLGTGQMVQDFCMLAELCQDLGTVVERVVQKHEGNAAACDLGLETEVQTRLPPVLLVETFFENALDRLLDNAVKFSQGRGKQVTVRSQAVDGWVEIAVSDEGVGIAAKDIPHLFERFRQIDRERKEQQGVGLGLAVARELIHLHGGDIDVESTPGKGSTFTIRLPVA